MKPHPKTPTRERRLRLRECNMSLEKKLAKFSGLKPDETRLSEGQMLVGVRSEPAIWTDHRRGGH